MKLVSMSWIFGKKKTPAGLDFACTKLLLSFECPMKQPVSSVDTCSIYIVRTLQRLGRLDPLVG